MKLSEEERLRRKKISSEKRNEKAKEYAARKRCELRYVKDTALLLYNELVRMGAYQKLSDEAKDFFDLYLFKEVMRTEHSYPPNVYKMFGETIAPGVRVTLREAMSRMYKGKNEINALIRRWAHTQGIHVDIVEGDTGSALDDVYLITAVDEPEKKPTVERMQDLLSSREKKYYRDFVLHK